MDVTVRTVFQRLVELADELCMAGACLLYTSHRVIGASGQLTGYGGGLDKKEALLRLEGVLL